MIFIVEKQPWEVVPVTINFTKTLPAGETVGNNSTVIAFDNAGNDASNNVIVTSLPASPYLTATVQGGNDGETFTLTFRCWTSPGNYKFEEDVVLKILEKMAKALN